MPHPAFPRWRDEHTRYLLLAVVSGIFGAATLRVFSFLYDCAVALYPGDGNTIVQVATSLPVSACLLAPLAGGILAGILKSFAHRISTESGGPSEVMEIVSLSRRTASLRATALKAISSFVSLATGASVGREGPIVSISTALSATLGNRARLSDEHFKVLTAAGLAAGIAAAYNTPFAATLFVLEIVIGSFNMRFFGPVMVASLVATVPGRLFLGRPPIYAASTGDYVLVTAWEFLLYPVLGILCGIVSVVALRTLRGSRALFSALPLPAPVLLGCAGLAVGAIGIRYPEVWGNGYDVVNAVFLHLALPPFLLLLAAKLAATAISSGSGTYGGIFTPTLFLGACAGGAFGVGVLNLLPGQTAGAEAYALLGMAGVLAGMLRAPLLAIVMVFELTGDFETLIPLMIASGASFYTTSLFEKVSLYTEELERKGLVWEGSPEERVLRGLRVGDIMRPTEPLITESTPAGMVLEVLLSSRANLIFVTDTRGRLAGVIDIHDAESLLRNQRGHPLLARDLVRPVPELYPDTPLADAITRMWDREPGVLPVVDAPASRRFLGIVTRRDILAAIDREVLRRNVMLSRFAYAESGGAERTDFFELPARQEMALVEVHPAFVGETIGDLQVQTRWGLNVLALTRLRSDGTKLRVQVGAKTRLEPGDHLTVLGDHDAITAFRRGEDLPKGETRT